MCNLIHEEIISHPITGSQEDQVRSGRSVLLLLSMKQSLPGHLPIQRIRCCGKYDRKTRTYLEEEEQEEQEQEEEEKVPSLPR